ncbi:MAG: hypothetical protein J1E97_03045 [Muribaculaceae bacterium]|nr:hypothetical protein [Muribaculaceae bacterium]
MERKNCPYCGEEIALLAKKCRFCGEWLPEETALQEETAGREYINEEPATLEVAASGENPDTALQPTHRTLQPSHTATVMNNETPNKGLQQNIVVQPQIVIENKQEVHQEQNMEVNILSGERESPGGCLWSQLVVLAIGLGFVFKGFWYGVAAFILLAIAIYIPVLGPALCVVLGAAFGVVAGVLSASFGAATWIAWLIGIVCSIGLIYANLAQRDSEV